MLGRNPVARLFPATLAAIMLAALTGPAIGQGPRGVRDRTGKPLTDATGRVIGKVALARNAVGDPETVWVTHEDYQALEAPGPASADNRPSGWPTRIRFMDSFAYVDEYVDPSHATYYLLARSTADGSGTQSIVGWVDGRYVLSVPNAEVHPETKIVRKAMIVNRPRPDGGAIEQGVYLRRAPTDQAASDHGEIKLMSLFFVYARTPTHYLLGIQPSFSLAAPKEIVWGWAPIDRVVEWLTREGLEWAPYNPVDPRMVPGQLLSTSEDAWKHVKGGAVAPLMLEGKNANGQFGQDWPPDKPRYPVLEWYEKTVDRRLGTNQLFRVGVIGGFEGQGKGFDPERYKKTTEALARQSRQVELLFVIDETTSMDAWFGVVAQMVERALTRARQDAGRVVKVAVAYYGDTLPDRYNRPCPASTPAPLVESRSGAAVAAEVRGHEARGGGATDPLERVFKGIGDAIVGAGFSPNAVKMVIVLGDMGNKHEAGDPSADDLAGLLVPRGELPIELLAIQVCSPENNGDAGRRFRAEMQDLVRRARDRAEAEFARIARENNVQYQSGELSDYFNVRQAMRAPGETVKYIAPPESEAELLDRFEKLYTAAAARADSYSMQYVSVGIDPDSVIAPELIKVLQESYGYDINAIRQVRDFQLFTPGYVWSQNDAKQDQVRKRMLINDYELREFLQFLAPLAKGARAGKLTPAELMTQVIANQAGQGSVATTSFRDLLYQRTGLQVSSPLLNRVMDEVAKGEINNPFRRQELFDIAAKYDKLEDIRDGVAYDYVERTINVGGQSIKTWSRGPKARSANRAFYLNGDESIKWYYLILPDEWP